MEETTKELAPRASEEPMHVPTPARHRFYDTRLWGLIRGEIEMKINGWACIECRGVEKECQCRHSPPAANGSVSEGLSAILDEFLIELQSYCWEEKDLTERMRTLRFTRSELITALFMRTPPEAKKQVDISTLVEQALDIFDCELKIIDMELEHPELRGDAPAPVRDPRPSLYLIPKDRNLGIMGMTEILTALQLLGGIGSSTGNEPTTIAFADVFEQTFGFSFNDIYDRQFELFQRMPCNVTKTLDAMKAALIKEYRRRQAARKENGGKKE